MAVIAAMSPSSFPQSSTGRFNAVSIVMQSWQKGVEEFVAFSSGDGPAATLGYSA